MLDETREDGGWATPIGWKINGKETVRMGALGSANPDRFQRFWISVDGSSSSPWSDGHFTITSNANVGIGTNAPNEKLAVAGNVLAEEVIVKPQSEWADYVFEEGYDLRSLEEVARFIEEEGHLPEVPTAESVEENGLRLREMDATLLKKVEELTLYLVDQQEKIKRLRRENQQLEDRLTGENERLRQRLEAQQRQIDRLLQRVEKQAVREQE
jgi:hypothetical protein